MEVKNVNIFAIYTYVFLFAFYIVSIFIDILYKVVWKYVLHWVCENHSRLFYTALNIFQIHFPMTSVVFGSIGN